MIFRDELLQISFQIKVEVESDSETKELESKTDDSKDTNTDMHTYQNFTMLDGALQGFTLPEEKYQCHLCKEAFFSEPLFHLHMESHAGVKPVIKPHVCPQCFTSFKRKSHLDQHMQTHSDVREYECKMCERSYKRKGELMRHLKSHSGNICLQQIRNQQIKMGWIIRDILEYCI